MPIKFSTEKGGWYIDRPSKEEQAALVEVGKMMIVQGLAGSYTNERLKNWLASKKIEQMFTA